MSAETSEVIENAVALWKNAGVLQLDARSKLVPEIAVIESMRTKVDAYEPMLIELLQSQEQLVVAYALLALKRLKSGAIQSPPEFLVRDKRRVMRIMGSFAPFVTIAQLLKELQFDS